MNQGKYWDAWSVRGALVTTSRKKSRQASSEQDLGVNRPAHPRTCFPLPRPPQRGAVTALETSSSSPERAFLSEKHPHLFPTRKGFVCLSFSVN